MKKSDLRTGMWVELRDGKKAMVLLGTNNGDIVSSKESWFPINEHWTESLGLNGYAIPSTDVMKIYQPRSNMGYTNHSVDSMELIWEREPEPIEMTLEEACKKLREAMGKPVKITI